MLAKMFIFLLTVILLSVTELESSQSSITDGAIKQVPWRQSWAWELSQVCQDQW